MENNRRIDTTLTHAGRDRRLSRGAVNLPPFRASTVLFDSLADLRAWDADFREFQYGRLGTPSSRALEDAYAELEGADRAIALSCGMAAVSVAISAFLRAGDHILVTAGAYEPGIGFCHSQLGRFGVQTELYEPDTGAEISSLLRPETRLVYLESPSSRSFEVQDVSAIVAAVKARSAESGRRIVTVLDNTWATPVNFRPMEHGVDVVVQAATKYIVGHSDAMLGLVACREADFKTIKNCAVRLGINPGAEEIYLGLRGLRTLSVRLERHFTNAMKIAGWLSQRDEVAKVLFPPLPGAPGHALWQRDFDGGSSLMGIVLKNRFTDTALAAMLDNMRLFGMGFSFGGYESLLIPSSLQHGRDAEKIAAGGSMLRLYAGLEDSDDLIADLDAGFKRLAAAG